jgi:hypothetical protein
MNAYAVPGLDNTDIVGQIIYARESIPTSNYILVKIAKVFLNDNVTKVLKELGYTPDLQGLIDAIKGRTRRREIVLPRQAYCYYNKLLTRNSLKSIGKTLKRDHSTVIHGITTWRDLSDVDKYIKSIDERVRKELKC